MRILKNRNWQHRLAVRAEQKDQKGALEERREGVLVAEPQTKIQKPPFYKVLLLNDDYTPMDFVVEVLKSIFHKQNEEAISIMLMVHHKGAGICGVFTRDVAETKVDQVIHTARQNEYPLQCVMEKD